MASKVETTRRLRLGTSSDGASVGLGGNTDGANSGAATHRTRMSCTLPLTVMRPTALDPKHADRTAATLRYVAAKPYQRLVREHGHPCRIVVSHCRTVLRVAYVCGGWCIAEIELRGDEDRDTDRVMTWLGY